MKKTGLFHKLVLAFLGAAAWLGTAALGAIELEVDEIGPSLRYATAQVTRAASGGGNFGGGGGQQRPQQVQQAEEPWATPGSAAPDAWSAPGSYGDDTPF